MKNKVKEILNDLALNNISQEQAFSILLNFLDVNNKNYLELGHSCLDMNRAERTGLEEVVFASNKSSEHLILITKELLKTNSRVLITKTTRNQAELLKANFDNLQYLESASVACLQIEKRQKIGKIGIITAGTSDVVIADEAEFVAKYFGLDVFRKDDVGVAGLERVLKILPELNKLDILIVIAGMEGALVSVVSGLTSAPLIAVPTDVGYGVNLGGITTLFSMLLSCSPGVAVVNINNGFGAAVAAYKLIKKIRT